MTVFVKVPIEVRDQYARFVARQYAIAAQIKELGPSSAIQWQVDQLDQHYDRIAANIENLIGGVVPCYLSDIRLFNDFVEHGGLTAETFDMTRSEVQDWLAAR